jgi:hypothetical protein
VEPAVQKLSRTILELEKWSDIFRRELFANSLSSRAVITVQSTGRKRSVLGWHWNSRWQNRRSKLAEINIVAESLKRRAEEILETLLHEMCHQRNAERKIQDVSTTSYQYHNEKFKRAAEAAGLVCERMGRYGWAKTSLGPKAIAVIQRHAIDRQAFTIARLAEEDPEKKKVSKHKKWVCDCGAIRVARADFHAICLVCDKEFELVMEEAEGEGHETAQAAGKGEDE